MSNFVPVRDRRKRRLRTIVKLYMEGVIQELKKKKIVVLKQIGEGSFATCFLAIQQPKNFMLVVKLIDQKHFRKEEVVVMERIVQSKLAVESGRIVQIFEVVQIGAFTVIVMEYCENGDL